MRTPGSIKSHCAIESAGKPASPVGTASNGEPVHGSRSTLHVDFKACQVLLNTHFREHKRNCRRNNRCNLALLL